MPDIGNIYSVKKKIPLLGDNDEIANHNYVKYFMLDLDSQYLRGVVSYKEVGKNIVLSWRKPSIIWVRGLQQLMITFVVGERFCLMVLEAS